METVRKFPDCLLFVDEYYVALNPVIFQLLFALFILSVRVQSVNWVKATLIMVYPILGWLKTRINLKIRYLLIVMIVKRIGGMSNNC